MKGSRLFFKQVQLTCKLICLLASVLMVSCASTTKPQIHLHLSDVDNVQARQVQDLLESHDFHVSHSSQDFSHFLVTPLIVTPSDQEVNVTRIEQIVLDVFGVAPIVTRGHFSNHQYKAANIGLYIRGHHY